MQYVIGFIGIICFIGYIISFFSLLFKATGFVGSLLTQNLRIENLFVRWSVKILIYLLCLLGVIIALSLIFYLLYILKLFYIEKFLASIMFLAMMVYGLVYIVEEIDDAYKILYFIIHVIVGIGITISIWHINWGIDSLGLAGSIVTILALIFVVVLTVKKKQRI